MKPSEEYRLKRTLKLTKKKKTYFLQITSLWCLTPSFIYILRNKNNSYVSDQKKHVFDKNEMIVSYDYQPVFFYLLPPLFFS